MVLSLFFIMKSTSFFTFLSGLFHVHFLVSLFLYLLLPMYSFLLAANSTSLSPLSLRSPIYTYIPYTMYLYTIILLSFCFLIPILALKSPITMVYGVATLSISSFISSYILSTNSSLYADVGAYT